MLVPVHLAGLHKKDQVLLYVTLTDDFFDRPFYMGCFLNLFLYFR